MKICCVWIGFFSDLVSRCVWLDGDWVLAWDVLLDESDVVCWFVRLDGVLLDFSGDAVGVGC